MNDTKNQIVRFCRKHDVAIGIATVFVASAAAQFAVSYYVTNGIAVDSVLISDDADGVIVTHKNGMREFFQYKDTK